MASRGTRPTGPRRWPTSQEQRRKQTIELADAVLSLLEDARSKVEKRSHPMLVQLDLADAMRYAETIKRLMTEAGIGLE